MAGSTIIPRSEGELKLMDENSVKKNIRSDVHNRRPLIEIGNLGGGPDVKLPNLPITRGSRAQLVAKTPAKADAENIKPFEIDDIEDAAVSGAMKVLNDITPNTEDKEVKKDQRKTARSKKKINSLTSVLMARSKAACGVAHNQKASVVDIDAIDADNEFAALEYVEDIYKFYRTIEKEIRISDYMASQKEINPWMRSVLVDWLICVHQHYKLLPETLYLSVNIVDRFLSVMSAKKRCLQLVGIGAMLIASKYEEISAPEVNDFVEISDRAYTNKAILYMEKAILNAIEWKLTVATPYMFLVRFIKAAIPDTTMEHMSHFFSELGMMHYAVAVKYCPSMVAASAVYAARCALSKTPKWDATLELYTGYSEAQLMDCANLLLGYHSTVAAADYKLKGVYKKYSSPERGAVALLTPAKTE